jgi:hypothetical protein
VPGKPAQVDNLQNRALPAEPVLAAFCCGTWRTKRGAVCSIATRGLKSAYPKGLAFEEAQVSLVRKNILPVGKRTGHFKHNGGGRLVAPYFRSAADNSKIGQGDFVE